MKSEEIYNNWKEVKSQTEVGKGFADEVMTGIYRYERVKRLPLFDMEQLFKYIYSNRLTKAGLIAAGAVIGFVRVGFAVYMFLGY